MHLLVAQKPFLIALAFLSSPFSFALAAASDMLVIESLAYGGAVTRIWTTSDKQRNEVTAEPGSDFAKMMADLGGDSPQIRIVRLDLGVAWTLNLAEKSYTEEPLAIPYEPIPPSEDSPEGEPAQAVPTPTPFELKETAGNRTFAGHSARGMQLLADGKRLGTLWLAALEGPLAQAQKLLETFHQRETEARFKGWPPKDRALFQGEPDLLAATPVAGTIWGGAALHFEAIRRGFVLALQAGDDEPGLAPDTLVMQIRSVTLESLDPILFELPEGFRKIETEAGH